MSDVDPVSEIEATFYFDLGSPFAYLAAERLPRFGLQPNWRPISLGALFKATGRSSWGVGPRRELGMAEIESRARAYSLAPIVWPDGWPSNYLKANRACVVAEQHGVLEPFSLAALRMAFVEGADLSRDEAILEAGRRVGLDPTMLSASIEEPPIKQRLREYTDAAHARGVDGVPTLELGGRLFWGDDQLEIATAG